MKTPLQFRYCPHCAHPLETQRIENIMRQVCSAPNCGYVFWNNPVPVVAALVEYQGQFILARNAQWPRRIYSVITGFMEREETPEQAVVREVQEELNLDSMITQFIGHYPFAEMNQLILAFAVRATGELKMNAELAETKLLALDQLKTYDFAPLHITSAIVNDWLAR